MKTLKKLLLPLFLLVAISANADVITWIGGAGNWADENNWDTGEIPKLDDGVIINSGIVTVDSYAEANYIHLDGGDLEVVSNGLLYVSPSSGWYGSSNLMRGMVIENGSSFNNSGSSLFMQDANSTASGVMIFCFGELFNNPTGFLFLQGEYSTGLHTYLQAGSVENYGDMVITGVETGMYLLSPFKNYGDIEIGCDDSAVTNRVSYYGSSSSSLVANGRIADDPGATWTEYGDLSLNYTSAGNTPVMSIRGTFEIMNGGSVTVEGSHAPVIVGTSGVFRVRGGLDIVNNKAFSGALTVQGFMVNHQKGVVSTAGYYGVINSSFGEVRNFGTWRMNETSGSTYCTLWNDGIFSNRPKGKLYVEHRLRLGSGSFFNNQGHMFVLDDLGHESLDGQFNNTGTLNDVHDHMSSINNNTSIRVHKMAGPFTEGVPVPDVLDVGSSPGATVLNWYTTSSGSTIAGAYNSSTNTFTPNANAVGLTSLFVRTRINTGGVTRRHELIIENGINPNPSPLVIPNSEAKAISNISVTVAPNLIQEDFSIYVGNTEQSRMNYSIYNTMGQCESFGVFDTKSNSIKVPSHVPSGIYYVKITDQDGLHLDTQQIRIVR